LSRRRSPLAQRLLAGVLCLTAALLGRSAEARAEADAWRALQQPGHVAFMRHSDAPGGAGDPAGFRLDDCATQRNLSEEGRAQARRTGAALARYQVTFDRVLTSPWCRCRETAQLVSDKVAEDFDALSNLVGRQEHRATQVTALKSYLSTLDPGSRVLFVTHGILMSALLGINAAQGEIVVVRVAAAGEPTVVGRLLVD
jgi:phosphohistidine phosphatase SixA